MTGNGLGVPVPNFVRFNRIHNKENSLFFYFNIYYITIISLWLLTLFAIVNVLNNIMFIF